MRGKHKAGIVLVAVALLGAALSWWWVHDAPRRQSLASLARLDNALHSGSHAELLDLIALPAAVQGRTAPEQSEFLVKALNDEISPEGLAVLRKHGDYGPLRKLFPVEAETWAKQAGVNPDQCVAFKLDRHGLRAEVVLVPDSPLAPRPSSPGFRIVRLNNVKQMADSNL
jgi:hypothetical protein